MQSKVESLVESCVNTLIGFLVALVVQMFVIAPLFNLPTTKIDDFLITTIFTVLSVIRGYYCRRFFNYRSISKMLHKPKHKAR